MKAHAALALLLGLCVASAGPSAEAQQRRGEGSAGIGPSEVRQLQEALTRAVGTD